MRFSNFKELLEYYAKAAPDAPALKDGHHVFSYAQLLEKVQDRAALLGAEGRSCVAVVAECSIDCVIEVFAASLAGLRIVMLDESLPEELLRELIGLTEADLVWASDPEFYVQVKRAHRDKKPEPVDSMLFFTSGTTSRSKAVMLSARSLCSSAWNGAQKLPLAAGDVLLCVLPLAHVFGFVCGLLWGLSCGACVAMGSGTRGIFTDFARLKPTAVSLVPAQLAYMLKAQSANPELKTVLVGAGDCSPELLENTRALGLQLSFGYGLTETSSGVAISTGGDPFAMDICPDDKILIAEDGEVLIYAPTCVMEGYYKDPEGTKAAFCYVSDVAPDGTSEEREWLRSGDLGFLDADGRLHITGRKKDMLVLSDGSKIFLPEYEAALAKALEGAPGGAGTTQAGGAADNKAAFELAAVLSPAGRPVLAYYGPLEKKDILARVQPLMQTLPRGQQITDIIKLAEPLPRTATGKIKRWEIKQ